MAFNLGTLNDIVKERLTNNDNKPKPVVPTQDSEQAVTPPVSSVPASAFDLSQNKPQSAGTVSTDNNNLLPNTGDVSLTDAAGKYAETLLPTSTKTFDSYNVSDDELNAKFGKAPDLSSMIDMINEDVAKKKADSDKARSLSYIPALADIAFLVSDFIGAKGGANVEKREPATGKYNAFVENMTNLYRQAADKRPERVAQFMMENYKNRLNRETLRSNMQKSRYEYDLNLQKQKQAAIKTAYDLAYKDRIIAGKDKEEARKAAEGAAKLEAQKLDREERARHNKAMEDVSGMNARTNRQRANAYESKVKNDIANPKSKGKTVDILDQSTGNIISVPESAWKGSSKQLMADILPVIESDPDYRMMANSIKRGKIKGNVLDEIVKQFINSSPAAMNTVRQMAGMQVADAGDTYEEDFEDY
ncbi:hypothetical protein [Dysgonomonas termitidis]|uniref:Uncharacterized protein n=1 Tax=Dysgonomonas termitidis TaxID=1516126 RepID=A0ABV9L1Q1_9BACT